MTCKNIPGTCSSCGFPISDRPPAHKTSLEPDHLGQIREVCDRCWHDPALFFLPRELEKYGNYPAVVEAAYRRYLGIPDGQTTFGSVVPESFRRSLGI